MSDEKDGRAPAEACNVPAGAGFGAPSCPHCSHPMAHFQGAQWQCAMSTCPTFGVVVTSPAPVSASAKDEMPLVDRIIHHMLGYGSGDFGPDDWTCARTFIGGEIRRASASPPRELKREPYDPTQTDASRAVTYLKRIGMPGTAGDILKFARYLSEEVLTPIRISERERAPGSASPDAAVRGDHEDKGKDLALADLRAARAEILRLETEILNLVNHGVRVPGSRSPERVRRERFELMSAVVAKAGGAVTLTDLELVDACGYHLERIDHMMGGITLRVPSMVPMAAPCASQEQTSGAGVSDFAPADTTTPAGVPGEAGIYSNMTDAVRAAFVSCAPPLPPGTTFITTTTSTAGPGSSLEERATAWVFREADDGRDDVSSLAALLADVRRETIEACCDWVKGEEGRQCAADLAKHMRGER